jgi:hypothetical protein
MEDLAEQIVFNVTPRGGFSNPESEAKLIEVALAMLDDMDPDTVEECFETIAAVLRAESA